LFSTFLLIFKVLCLLIILGKSLLFDTTGNVTNDNASPLKEDEASNISEADSRGRIMSLLFFVFFFVSFIFFFLWCCSLSELCKYGALCHRKNAEHLEKYAHPPKAKREEEAAESELRKRPKLEQQQLIAKPRMSSFIMRLF
jgi:hypothetical protein